ncbi:MULTISPECIES: molecular chaperone HscC [unclassified Ochrobactrum]|uniref:molecular chaperone HscC n=1 Tax=unclassified Ochrobactrum TaxID=239106 RepID=UPI000DEF91B2|nr:MULTISPECIES: molecular chaperone HscC [unclassified Ochrobactrum]MBQ0709919.1 molecular chaperone HscC [Ochrobactrum sp. AP1BH01-1]
MAIVGIDLGTSNSLVLVWENNGPRALENALGETLTPSAVSISDEGEVLVGRAAIDRLITHPDRTVASFKRAMGSAIQFTLGNYRWRAEELSALVLKSLRQDAELALGEPITEAVISVPAYFNDIQRKATLDAARLAGLHVERLINEPTAAALAHGLEHQDEGTFLVLDLGGGTFDVSLLHKYDDVMEIRASAGDALLGGDDFRTVIVTELLKRHQLVENDLDAGDKARLFAEAERLKRALTEQSQLEYSFGVKGERFSGLFERLQFEELAQPLLRRMRAPMERALRDARVGAGKIDQVVLVGGAARMPMVRSLAARLFGRFPLLHPWPDHIVGLGAAVQAGLRKREGALEEIIMTDVCPFTLGTSVLDPRAPEGVVLSPIIERNAVVPISRESRYWTASDGQTVVRIDVLQGENMRPSQNIALGMIEVPVSSGPAGKECVDVRYTYDVNGALEVEVKVVSTGQVHRRIFRNQANLTDAELEARFSALSSIKMLPRDQQENRALIARAERLYAETLGDARDQIREMLFWFEKSLEDQSIRDPQAIRQQFSDMLQQFEKSVL